MGHSWVTTSCTYLQFTRAFSWFLVWMRLQYDGQVLDFFFVVYLDVFVPSSGDNDGVGGVGGEPNAADPVGVALVTNGVLALGEGVPQLDGLIPACGHNLPVVGGKGHGQDVLGVVLEPAGGLPGAQVPETEVLVPGAG